MQPFRYCGEWLFSSPQRVIVERFCGWRRGGKRRLFQPFAILRVGEHRIIVDGYVRMWGLIDAIQPDMPRRMVDEGMKGGFHIDGHPSFADDLQSFFLECADLYVCFRYEDVSIGEPNSDKVFTGMSALGISTQKVPELFCSAPLNGVSSFQIHLPFRTKGATHTLPSLVIGDYPHLVVAQNLSEGEHFSFDAPSLISSLVCDAKNLDSRPHRTVKRDSNDAITLDIERRLFDLNETGWRPNSCREKESGGSMTFSERDSIEYERSVRLFFSLD